ncbi:hypothetical protein GEMRC1_007623 [Eukaryota sp. GEM-RC1]
MSRSEHPSKEETEKKWLKWYCKKNSMDFQEEWRKAEEEFEKRAEVKPWGLLKCKYCTTMWDRDFNSGINIMEIMKAKLAGLPRPTILSRSQSEQMTSEISCVQCLETEESEEKDVVTEDESEENVDVLIDQSGS